MDITEEELKKRGIPDSELTKAWNYGNLANSYFPVRERYFKDRQGNVKCLFVEATTEGDVLSGDDREDSFPDWDQYVINNALELESALDDPKGKRSIIMYGAGASFTVEGSDHSGSIRLNQHFPRLQCICFSCCPRLKEKFYGVM